MEWTRWTPSKACQFNDVYFMHMDWTGEKVKKADTARGLGKTTTPTNGCYVN